MPNWCSNRYEITGPESQIAELEKILSGDQYVNYLKAIDVSKKIFLAGAAGLLKPITEIIYDPYPALTSNGLGIDNDINRAFTEWLGLLINSPILSQENYLKILSLYERTQLKNKVWGEIDKSKRKIIKGILFQKHFDWFDFRFRGVNPAILWINLDVPRKPMQDRFHMDLIIPSNLSVELNGYNGRLLKEIESGYHHNCERLGVKWSSPEIYYQISDTNSMTIDFDTAWTSPNNVTIALSEKYQCNIKHYYSEKGCGFCGLIEVDEGEVINSLCDDLVLRREKLLEGPNGFEYYEIIYEDIEIRLLDALFNYEPRIIYESLTIQKALNASKKIYLAGMSELLKPINESGCKFYPKLTPLKIGFDNDINRAFTEWLELLANDIILDEANCSKILSLYERTQLKNKVWGEIDNNKRTIMKHIIRKHHNGWFQFYPSDTNPERLWSSLDVFVKFDCDDYDDFNVVGPSYILFNVAHHGG